MLLKFGRHEVKEKFSGSAFDFIDVTGGIVAAYGSNNSRPAAELPNLIHSVYGTVRGLISGSEPSESNTTVEAAGPSTAQIRKSVRPDGIVSFIDGKAYKTLKRHLTSHGLDPEACRGRYGLPADYPMVATEYAEKRSALAKAIGLGQPGVMAERPQQQMEGRRSAA